MDVIRCPDQLFIGPRRSHTALYVAMSASEVQPQIRQRLRTILGELLNLVRIDLHEMGPDVAGENFGVAQGALRHSRHMAFNALGSMELDLEVFSLIRVTILALGTSRLDIRLTKLNNTFVRIMAGDAVDGDVFALEQFFVLFVVLNETTTGVDFFFSPSEMAVAAGRAIAINVHAEGHRILDVSASRTMALLAPDTALRKGADHAR